MWAVLALSVLAQVPESGDRPWPPLAWTGETPAAQRVTLLDAPTSPSVAVATDLLAFASGAGLVTAFGVWQNAFGTSQAPLICGITLGALLVLISPNLSDLLNGDWVRFVSHVLIRGGMAGAVTLVAFIPGIGALLAIAAFVGWLAFTVYDFAVASDAPDRWLERERNRIHQEARREPFD